MKKLTALLFICFLCSCESTGDPTPGIGESTLKAYTFKTLNNDNSTRDSVYYELQNNRIISTSGVFNTTQRTTHTNYTYEDGRLIETITFSNGELIAKSTFQYEGDNLTEAISQAETQTGFSYRKWTYEHTSDTIYVKNVIGTDGINFDRKLADSKIVLDENDNRVYFEEYDHLNDDTQVVIMEYDERNNPTTETRYTLYEHGLQFAFAANSTHDNTRNTFYDIREATYGRKTLMLLYHVYASPLNSVNSRHISPNIVDSYTTTLETHTYDFQNHFDGQGQLAVNTFKMWIYGDLFKQNVTEYIR